MVVTSSVLASPTEAEEAPAMLETPAVSEAATVPVPDGTPTQRTLYLAGRPSMRQFLQYVRKHALTPPDERALADRWREANAVVRGLDGTEAGIADGASVTRLGKEYEPLLVELLSDRLIRDGYNTVPTDIGLVELDRLVVWQKHIDVTFAEDLARRLGPRPSMETVFRTCLPFDHPTPPARWSRGHGNSFVFVSPSNDLRYLGVLPMLPANLANCAPRGTVVGVVGVTVGFGPNFLNAIASEGRIMLNNGSHRAYALRRLGLTHVPCIVQHASSREEFSAVADRSVAEEADAFLTAPRPSMLRDYLDPRLFTEFDSRRQVQEIRVTFETDSTSIPVV